MVVGTGEGAVLLLLGSPAGAALAGGFLVRLLDRRPAPTEGGATPCAPA
jgi:hypothetical protein